MKVKREWSDPSVPHIQYPRRLMAGAILAANGFCANLLAAPPAPPAPELFPGPIPVKVECNNPEEEDCEPNTGYLDIDFRLEEAYFEGPDGEFWSIISETTATLGRFKVTADGGQLTQNVDCPDLAESPLIDSMDGFGVGDITTTGKDCDDDLGKQEKLTLTICGSITPDGVCIPPAAGTTAANDVNGVWVTGFDDKDSGIIELTGVDDEVISYSFSWKDVDPDDISTQLNPNDEFFVGFGETVRFTSAAITSSGSFSVAGFSQQPIVLYAGGECANDPDPENPSNPNPDGCLAEEAKNFYLNVNRPDFPSNGDEGVEGVIYRRGVFVVDDHREQCRPEFATDPDAVDAPPFASWQSLEVCLEGACDGEPDLVMEPWHCGYPEIEGGVPRFYVVRTDGSDLDIKEDTIENVFKDDENLVEDPRDWVYYCRAYDDTTLSPTPWFHPIGGYAPIVDPDAPIEEREILVLDANGVPSRSLNESTIGPCNGFRGSTASRTYLVYHAISPANTPYHSVLQQRVDNRLRNLVRQLFPCLQQSQFASVRDNVSRIGNSLSQGDFEETLRQLAELEATLLVAPLNDSLGAGACFYDLEENQYLASGPYPPPDPNEVGEVPGANPRFREANAVGYLLVEIRHLAWKINVTLLGKDPALCPDSYCGHGPL